MPKLDGRELGLARKRPLPKGSHQVIREMARAGKSQALIASKFGMSPPTLRKALADEPAARVAWEEGFAQREADLIDQLHHPEKYIGDRFDPDKHPGIFAKLIGAKQLAAQHELNSKFGWRVAEDGTLEKARVSIEFKLPAALSADQFRAVVDGKAVRVD